MAREGFRLGLLRRKENRSQTPVERLISPDFSMQQAIKADFIRVASEQTVYPGYPKLQDRFRLTQDQVERDPGLVKAHKAVTVVPESPEELVLRPSYVDNLPKEGSKQAKGQLIDRPSKEKPDTHINPYLDDLIKPGGPGVATGPGENWHEDVRAADIVQLYEIKGEMYIVLGRRRDTHRLGIIGGIRHTVNGQLETPLETLKRELPSEEGHKLNFPLGDPIHDGNVADQRMTATRSTKSTVYSVVKKARDLKRLERSFKPKDGDDVEEVVVRMVTKDLLENGDENRTLFGSHATLITLAVKKWEEKTGKVVDVNGRIHDTRQVPESPRNEVQTEVFRQWVAQLRNPPLLKGIEGAYIDKMFLGGPTADKGVWREKFIRLLGDVARHDSEYPEYANLSEADLIGRMQEVTFNPVITDRDWEPSDAATEALNAVNDYVLLLHFPEEIDPLFKGTGSMVEAGNFLADVLLRNNVLVAAIRTSDEDVADNVLRARAKTFSDLREMLPEELKDRFIIEETLEKAAKSAWAKLKEVRAKPIHAQEFALQLKKKKNRVKVKKLEYFSGTSKPGTHEERDAMRARQTRRGVPTGEANKGLGKWDITIDAREIRPNKLRARVEVITVEPDPAENWQITGLAALEDVTVSFAREVLGAMGKRRPDPQYKFILLPDTDAHPELKAGEYKRAEPIIMQHYKAKCEKYPGFEHYVKIFTKREELEQYLDAVTDRYFRRSRRGR